MLGEAAFKRQRVVLPLSTGVEGNSGCFLFRVRQPTLRRSASAHLGWVYRAYRLACEIDSQATGHNGHPPPPACEGTSLVRCGFPPDQGTLAAGRTETLTFGDTCDPRFF
jgi:hypothetical protein